MTESDTISERLANNPPLPVADEVKKRVDALEVARGRLQELFGPPGVRMENVHWHLDFFSRIRKCVGYRQGAIQRDGRSAVFGALQ